MTYNEIIQQAGKRIKKHVYYIKNGTTTNINDNDVDTIKLSFKTDIIGTAINGCEISTKSLLDGDVYIQIEAKYDEYTATKLYGPYKIKTEPKYDANKKLYTYTLYDNILISMIDYEPLEVTYPISVYNFFSALCTKLGYTNNILSLPNGSRIIKSEIYSNIGYTYRDVLDDIGIANGVLFGIDGNEIKIISKGANSVLVDDNILKNSNIDFGEHFGPINSIVLSRGGEGDNVYIKDDASISQYGLHEFKIIDNQLMNENDRSDYLSALSTQLFGLEYDIYDTELVGYGDIGILDEVEFETGNQEYSSYIFNNEITLTSGYKQVIYNELPKENKTDYKSASETDRTINMAYVIARKTEAEVEILASKVVDISNIIKGTNLITLENAYEGALHKLSISGSMSLIYPSNDLYPSSTLYPLSSVLKVDNDEYVLDINYLRYLSSIAYDEFIYEDGKCKIIRRVGIDQNNQMYALDEEDIYEEQRDDIIINVKANSTIRMKSFNNLIYDCEYLLENKYTDTFANQVEVKSEINLLGDTIEQKVSQVADTNGNVTSASIILAVNNDTSLAEIQANKINLNGIVTANENFKILEDGSMETTNGTFNGIINGGKIEITGSYTEQNPYISVVSNNSTSSSPIGSTMWEDGITCYNYGGEKYPFIRTECNDGYAQLIGPNCEAYQFIQVSQVEKKKDIELLTESALKLIKNIDIYKYLYNNEKRKKKHIGVVIGDDYKYVKEITNEDNTAIDLYSFISICCKAIQEQQKEIEELGEEIKKCKK